MELDLLKRLQAEREHPIGVCDPFDASSSFAEQARSSHCDPNPYESGSRQTIYPLLVIDMLSETIAAAEGALIVLLILPQNCDLALLVSEVLARDEVVGGEGDDLLPWRAGSEARAGRSASPEKGIRDANRLTV